MSDDAKSPEKSGEDAVKLATDLANQGISVEQLLKGMNRTEINSFLISQYNILKSSYESLKAQFTELKNCVKSDKQETQQRIERILALMTANTTFIKQMIQLVDLNNEKITEQEKIINSQEFKVSSLIDRQNRYATSLTTMDQNFRTIMKEIQKLKDKDIEHDKFQFKVMFVVSVASGAFFWLVSGDNLAKLIFFLSELTGNK